MTPCPAGLISLICRQSELGLKTESLETQRSGISICAISGTLGIWSRQKSHSWISWHWALAVKAVEERCGGGEWREDQVDLTEKETNLPVVVSFPTTRLRQVTIIKSHKFTPHFRFHLWQQTHTQLITVILHEPTHITCSEKAVTQK